MREFKAALALAIILGFSSTLFRVLDGYTPSRTVIALLLVSLILHDISYLLGLVQNHYEGQG